MADYHHVQDNSKRTVLAMLGGDMLNVDNGWFCVGYFGFEYGGSGFRYSRVKGLAKAQARIER